MLDFEVTSLRIRVSYLLGGLWVGDMFSKKQGKRTVRWNGGFKLDKESC